MKFLAFLALSSLSVGAAMRTEEGERSLKILDGDTLVTEYRTDSRVPYLYPLVSPSGATLSRHWPMDPGIKEGQDHPHHRSFWLSHGSVNGYDFWAWKGKGDPHIEHKKFSNIEARDDSARFTVDLEWIADGAPLLREKRTYVVQKADKETITIELSTVLESLQDQLVFGDTKEGFCALRIDRTLRLKGPQAKGHMVDSEGRTDQECWGKRANWVAFYGPDENGKPAVIAMLEHPGSFRHPTWWHVRDYGLLAANPFGIHDFEGKKDPTLGRHVLERGGTLSFHYLIVLHHGTPASAGLAEKWSAFSKK